jgi:hypothetical protein
LLRNVAAGLVLTGCRIVSSSDLPEPPDFRIRIEPESVEARLTAQQRSQIVFLVRVFNEGPGNLFMPECGHELQRAAPNGNWTAVHGVACTPRTPPPFVLEPGGGYGYTIRIVAPLDSAPWQRGAIAGQYRAVSYISTEFRPAGGWGRPIALGLRTSPVFRIREEP